MVKWAKFEQKVKEKEIMYKSYRDKHRGVVDTGNNKICFKELGVVRVMGTNHFSPDVVFIVSRGFRIDWLCWFSRACTDRFCIWLSFRLLLGFYRYQMVYDALLSGFAGFRPYYPCTYNRLLHLWSLLFVYEFSSSWKQSSIQIQLKNFFCISNSQSGILP